MGKLLLWMYLCIWDFMLSSLWIVVKDVLGFEVLVGIDRNEFFWLIVGLGWVYICYFFFVWGVLIMRLVRC